MELIIATFFIHSQQNMILRKFNEWNIVDFTSMLNVDSTLQQVLDT